MKNEPITRELRGRRGEPQPLADRLSREEADRLQRSVSYSGVTLRRRAPTRRDASVSAA